MTVNEDTEPDLCSFLVVNSGCSVRPYFIPVDQFYWPGLSSTKAFTPIETHLTSCHSYFPQEHAAPARVTWHETSQERLSSITEAANPQLPKVKFLSSFTDPHALFVLIWFKYCFPDALKVNSLLVPFIFVYLSYNLLCLHMKAMIFLFEL